MVKKRVIENGSIANIHPTAIIHPKAKLGQNLRVGPYAIIGEHVEIGDHCEVGPRVIIDGYTTIGEHNRFFHGAQIGCETNNPRFKNKNGLLQIGNGNTFRENVLVSGGIDGDGTNIGNSNLMIANCQIHHDCRIANHAIINYLAILSEYVVVEDRAIISGLSEVQSGVKIGKLAMIGFSSKITKDIPPFILVDGNPATVAGINVVGLRRNGIDSEGRERIKRAYRILYRSSLSLDSAIQQLENELGFRDEIQCLIEFLTCSKHGIQ